MKSQCMAAKKLNLSKAGSRVFYLFVDTPTGFFILFILLIYVSVSWSKDFYFFLYVDTASILLLVITAVYFCFKKSVKRRKKE